MSDVIERIGTAEVVSAKRPAVTARAKLTPIPSAPDIGPGGLDAPKFASEKQFQAAVVRLAKACGWIAYHTFDSRRSESGYPDLTLLHPVRGLQIVAELKVGKNKCSDAQLAWLAAFKSCGVLALEWRPCDWCAIEAILRGV